ncbi:MAG TPA: antibiotic biosynthesis monooxygenase [Candidatus Polarisedimenticolia bacterium]|nr:antibiotic biosynthesis monooxygenase [Candidatus Polarisedimenticolia bacterium]
MGAPVVFISRNRVKEGKLEGFRKACQDTSERLNRDKPGTVAFLAYVSDDGAEVSIIHLFPDADAMDRHLDGVAERTQLAYEFIESAGMEIYGKLNDAALQTFKQIAESGLPVTFRRDFIGGYLRPVNGVA